MHFLFSHWSKSSHFWVQEVVYRIGLLHTRCLQRFGPWLINSLKSSWPSLIKKPRIQNSVSNVKTVLPHYTKDGSFGVKIEGTAGFNMIPNSGSRLWFDRHTVWESAIWRKNWSLRKASLSSTTAERHRFQGFSRQEKWELNISLDASTKQSYSWISAAASSEFSRWSNTVRDVAFKRRPRWTKTNLPLEKAAPNSSIEKTTFLQCMVLPKNLLEINLFESSVDENKLSGRISTSPRNSPLSSLIRQTHRYGVRKKDSLKASFMKTPAGCFIYWIILLIYMGFTTNATTSMLSFTNQFCCHCSVDFVVSMPIGETTTVLTTAHGSPCGSPPWITRIPVGFSSPKLPSSMGQLQLHGSGCSLTLPKLQNGWRIYKCAFYQGLCKTRVLQSPRRNAHSVRFMWKSHFW